MNAQQQGARYRSELPSVDSLSGRETPQASELRMHEPPSRRYVWYVIGLLALVNVFNYMDRMALSVLLPVIQADLRLSDTELGLLVGIAFSLFYAICGVPIARWADHGVRRNVIAVALATWSAMTALSGAAQSFWQLFAARMGVGMGESGCLPPSQSLICDYVELKRRSGVFSLHSLGLYAGTMFGMAAAGWLAETVGWRWTFFMLGIPGIIVAVIVRVTLREPVRGAFDTVKNPQVTQSLAEAMRLLWGNRTYRCISVFAVAIGFVQYGLNQWWPSFYTRLHGLDLSSIGVQLGVAIGCGSAVGLLVGGVLANKFAQRDVSLPLKMGVIAYCVSLPVVLASLFVPYADASIWLVAFSGLLWSMAHGSIVAAMYSVVAPRMRSTAGSINVLFTSVLGFGLGPLCIGILSDALAPSFGMESLRYALLAPVFAIPVGAAALYAAARSFPSDLRSMST